MGDPLDQLRETAFGGAIDEVGAPAAISGHRADDQQRAGALLFEDAPRRRDTRRRRW